MRDLFKILLVFGVLPFLGADLPSDPAAPVAPMTGASNQFTCELLRQFDDASGGNVLLSPLTVRQNLLMSYIASGGDTRREMADVLHVSKSNDQIEHDARQLRHRLTADATSSGAILSMANGVWADESYATFQPAYLVEIERGFGTSPKSIRFRDRNSAASLINQWASEHTGGRIARVITPSDIPSRSSPDIVDEPALILANAVYFKANWQYHFHDAIDEPAGFHPAEGKAAPAKMMSLAATLRYNNDRKFQFLELPYAKRAYSMYILLPQSTLSPDAILKQISVEELAKLRMNAYTATVNIKVPKFEFHADRLSLTRSLKELGMKDAFDKNGANFDRMIVKTQQAYRIYLSDVLQSTRVRVDEQGAEVAAVTAASHYSFGCSMHVNNARIPFIADHPFAFFIVHNPSQAILFGGVVGNPG